MRFWLFYARKILAKISSFNSFGKKVFYAINGSGKFSTVLLWLLEMKYFFFTTCSCVLHTVFKLKDRLLFKTFSFVVHNPHGTSKGIYCTMKVRQHQIASSHTRKNNFMFKQNLESNWKNRNTSRFINSIISQAWIKQNI
jgi:hypothetical protein